MTKLRNKVGVCILCCVAACLLSASVVYVSNAASNVNIDKSKAELRDDGLIYGVPYEGEDGTVVIPDMAKVRATNGNYGYISTSDMHAAAIDYASTEEEKSEALANIQNLRADAFANAINDYFELDIISPDDLISFVDNLIHEGGHDAAQESLSAIIEEPALNILNSGLSNDAVLKCLENSSCSESVEHTFNLTEEAYEAIYSKAQLETAVFIPVYSSDGKDIVGEYQVNRI
jgi:hypothetical protein